MTWWQQALDWVVTRLLAYGRDVMAAVFAGWVFYALAPLAKYVNPAITFDPQAFFFTGFFGTITLLTFWLGSLSRLETELQHFQRLAKQGLITEEAHNRLRERAIVWYAARRFGGPLPDAPRATRRRGPRTNNPDGTEGAPDPPLPS